MAVRDPALRSKFAVSIVMAGVVHVHKGAKFAVGA